MDSLWPGHASLVDGVVAAGCDFDAVILSVGGGGLLCGVAQGLARNGPDQLPIIAVETAGADSLATALAADERIELPAITSIATTLGAKQVCEAAFSVARQCDVRSRVLTDLDAVLACERLLDDHRILVEPACGASLALAYGAQTEALAPFHRPLVVVCGGATVGQLAEWRRALTRDCGEVSADSARRRSPTSKLPGRVTRARGRAGSE